MNYIKKMCILRQVKQGFSGDGKTLSGLVKAEQYGKNLAVEVSVINFAPLIVGEYYCILSDDNGNTETLSLLGKSFFNILTDMDISNGFCAVICYINQEITPVAYGINGNHNYDFKKIVNATLPPAFYKKSEETATTETEKIPTPPVDNKRAYDDETVAEENYFKENEDESKRLSKTDEDAPYQSGNQAQKTEIGVCETADDDAENIRHPFEADGDEYYRTVKAEIDELFAKYPKDERLKDAFSCSEWVEIAEQEKNYLLGVIYDDGKAKYICYALPTDSPQNPPEEIKDSCVFIPLSAFDENSGFFVIFQSATTGACVKPNFC